MNRQLLYQKPIMQLAVRSAKHVTVYN